MYNQVRRKSKLKKILLAVVIFIAVCIFSILAFISIGYIATPLDKSRLVSTNLGVEIYDTTATTTPLYYSSDKKIVSNSNLQPNTLNAFIAVEDKRFYNHNGYGLKRIVKAGLVNLTTKSKSQGASTITQQLVKNILLNSEKTYSRKFKEIMLAIKTEKNFTKDEILNMYLNSIYFGSNAYGIENASNLYFNKSASELSLNESAILAGIIKSPVYYSPIHHPDKCFERKNIVLKQMYVNGYITEEEYNLNILEPVEVGFTKNNYDNSYNHQAIIEACELLNITEKELLRQELKIYTYLDNNIQQKVESAVNNSAFEQDKLSMVADNTGKVLAYYGDSYFDLSVMKRSPASTIKPLIIYLPAIASNLVSPISPLLDEPILDGYAPKNAGEHYMGWTSVREALAHSSNVGAVKLLNQIGLDIVNDYGYKLNLFNTRQTNPSLALGDIGGGATALQLARAYTVLQNNGIDKGLTFISKIEDKNGNIIYQDSGYSNTLFKQEDCMLVNDMLKTCATSGTAKRLSDLPFEVASKTGTAQINGKNTDLWNVAYTTNHLTLSWCGDATSKGLDNNFSSSFYPTIINKTILNNLYTNSKPENFKLNDNIVRLSIDSIEYNQNHTVALAPDSAVERYKIYDLFKIDNMPNHISSTYIDPTFNLKVDLTTKGAKISLDINSAYNYEIYSRSNSNIRLIGSNIEEISSNNQDTNSNKQYVYSNKESKQEDYSNNTNSSKNSDITNQNMVLNKYEIYDDKVYSYNLVEYYAVAVNKYTNEKFVSNKITLNPEEYLVDILNQQFVRSNKQTKTKWYV